MKKITKSKSIYTLTKPVWRDSAGLNKGLYHDKQHLGIILAAGEVLKIRQTNNKFNSWLSGHLLTDDSKTEQRFSLGTDWIEISSYTDSVPFIDTPYIDGSPQVTFEYAIDSKILPVLGEGENEEDFFQSWESQDAEYGLLEGEFNRLLVPRIDRYELKKAGPTELFAYYRRIFNLYNSLAGLSFDPWPITDRNSKNRYFMKADKNGVGVGYYGQFWTAESSSSMRSFWLTPEDNNWGSLHEIGHGYQGNFMDDETFSTGQVWCNIYAASYQNHYLGDRKYKEGWLYDYGKKAAVEKKIINYIRDGFPLNLWDDRLKLIFIMQLLDKVGNRVFTSFNQQYRKNCEDPNFIAYEHSLLDMLSESFSQTEAQFDVTPFILLVRGYITQEQQLINYYSKRRALYPVYQFVDASLLDELENTLKLNSPLQLVDTQTLSVTGLTGNTNLHLTIDDFKQIQDQELKVMDGASCVYKTRITQPNIVLNEIPIGIYSIILPTGRDKKYQPKLNHLVVKQGENIANIPFIKKQASTLLTQHFNLLGYGDLRFARLTVDHAQSKLLIDVTKKKPHYYFENQIYFKLTIRNRAGETNFTREIRGNNEQLSHDEIDFSVGDRIEIYHAEPNRLTVSPFYPELINAGAYTNILIIDKFGLINNDTMNDPEQHLIKRIEKEAKFLRASPELYIKENSPFKDDMYLAIDILEESSRWKYLMDYQDCISTNNTPLDYFDGDHFTITAKGIYDFQFLTASIDLNKQTVTIELERGIAHHYFSQIYASLVYEDVKGNVLYKLEIIGNKKQEMQSVKLPISGNGGEVIRIFHEEAVTRLEITNDSKKEKLKEQGKQQNYCLTTKGLKRFTD